MITGFFPSLDFAWIFLGLLFSLLALASSNDLRHYLVPKWITLSGLTLGVLGNTIRGAWLGGEGRAVWVLGEHGAVVGALDGLLFALAGFLIGFALFFVMWLLGVCGGGDVKLFGAIGAWIGPVLAICVLLVSIPLVFLFTMTQAVLQLMRGKLPATPAALRQRAAGREGRKPKRNLLGFSLPLTIAVAMVLLWVFRVELHLMPAQP